MNFKRLLSRFGLVAGAVSLAFVALLGGAGTVFVVVGDRDGLTSTAREWVQTMKDLKMKYKYIELGGADHGSVIGQAMPDIFAFLQEHIKPGR
jgi:hypothetical protein